jgi:hypothetical protein
MINHPLILYVPGLLPKPEAGVHRDALLRCLVAGVRRKDSHLADELAANDHCFDIVSWTYDFYGEHRDFAIDASAVEAVIAQRQATDQDILQASTPRRRAARWLFALADLLPFLIPHVANERMELHLRDLRRYLGNRNEIAEHVRQMLGSVIAYEALWQMSRSEQDSISIDLLLTMGSPLGQRYMQKRLVGSTESGPRRYPDNVRRWINLTAVGDLTAIDPDLGDDFAEMTRLGLVDTIEDHGVQNYFRLNGKLNVHSEYGYLVNPVTAGIVTDWWRSVWSK